MPIGKNISSKNLNSGAGAQNLIVNSSNSTIEQVGSSTYNPGTLTISVDLQATGTASIPGTTGNIVEIGDAPNYLPQDSGVPIITVIGNYPTFWVNMVYPSINQENVEFAPDIILQFNKEVGGVLAQTLYEDATNTGVDIVPGTSLSNNRVVWRPAEPLKPNTKYRFNIEGGTDASGNTLPSTNFYFTTGQNNIYRLKYQLGEQCTFSAPTVDPDGFIYAAGGTQTNIYGHTMIGNLDAMIVKYDEDLNIIWTFFDGAVGNNTNSYSISYADGFVYVSGATNGALHGKTNPGGFQYALWKLDASDGSLVEYNQSSSTGQSFAGSSKIQMAENDFVVAGFTNAPNLDGVVNPGGGNGYFVAKYNLNLIREWTIIIGAPGWNGNLAADVAIDSSGNIVVAGSTSVGLFGNSQVGVSDVFWARYNPAGTLIASTQYGVPGQLLQAYEIDSKDNYFVAVGITTTGFNGVVLDGTGGYFLQKVDFDFVNVWTTISQYDYDDNNTIEPLNVIIDNHEYMYVVGYSTFPSLDGIAMNPTYGAYYSKFAPDGTRLFTRGIGANTNTNSIILKSAINPNNNELVLAGWIFSGVLFPGGTNGGLTIMSFTTGEPTEELTYARSMMNYINNQNEDQFTRIDGSNILANQTDSENYATVNEIINTIDAVNWQNINGTLYTVAPGDRYLAITTDCTINLPDVATCVHAVTIVAAADPITVTINALGGQNITGSATYILNTPWSAITLLPNMPFGAPATTNNWAII